MGKISNDETRKVRNDHFIRAFEYIAEIKGISQGKLAETIGSKSSYISNYRKYLRPIPDETIEELIRFSTFEGCQIYSEYLYGNSDIMLLANVTDEEIIEVRQRKANPDYDTLKKRREESLQNPAMQSIDSSSAFNAAIAAHVRIIDTLESQLAAKEKEMQARLADKEAHIQSLERTIADKEEIIRSRDARIALLERKLADINLQDISRYPFSIGAAEDAHKKNVFPKI